jgi:hypothetical protein
MFSSVRMTSFGLRGSFTSYATLPSPPTIQARPWPSTCTSCVAIDVIGGLKRLARTGAAGLRRSTISIPSAVPAR